MATISFETPSETTTTPAEGQCCGAFAAPHPQNVQVPAVQSPGGLVLPHPQQALVPIAAAPVAVANTSLMGDSFPAFEDVILPRVNITQGSGQLKDSFPFGSLVFNQNTLLFALPVVANAKTGQPAQPGTPPVTITVLHVRPTRFAEKVPWPAKGRICNSEAEVTASGGTISYQEHAAKPGMPYFEYMVDTVVAIEKPEHLADDDSVFNYPVDGRKYTIGLWNFKATAYVAGCKRVLFYARRMGVCIKGYPTYSFSASTRIEPGKGNSYIVPVLVPCKKSTPEFLEFARSILNPA